MLFQVWIEVAWTYGGRSLWMVNSPPQSLWGALEESAQCRSFGVTSKLKPIKEKQDEYDK